MMDCVPITRMRKEQLNQCRLLSVADLIPNSCSRA